MNVEDGEVSLARAGIETLKHKFLSAGDVEQGEVFRGRSDENQIVILGVVEREQGAALHANGTIEKVENMVQLVDGQHLSHAGVVVKNKCARGRMKD